VFSSRKRLECLLFVRVSVSYVSVFTSVPPAPSMPSLGGAGDLKLVDYGAQRMMRGSMFGEGGGRPSVIACQYGVVGGPSDGRAW
jgi:hypothetical protein